MVIVHLKTYTPVVSPVIVVVFDEGVVMVSPAGPDTFVQAPVPTAGALAAMVADITLQRFWSDPAFETVAGR